MSKYDMIKEALEDMSDNDLLAVYREYCDEYGSMDDYIYDNDDYEIDELFYDSKPSEIVNRFCFGDYSCHDRYFRFDGYGNIQSFSGLKSDKSPIYIDDIADYIIDNDKDLGNDDIREILDNDEDEDFDESIKRRRFIKRNESVTRRKTRKIRK
jgi:hypothetical protein